MNENEQPFSVIKPYFHVNAGTITHSFQALRGCISVRIGRIPGSRGQSYVAHSNTMVPGTTQSGTRYQVPVGLRVTRYQVPVSTVVVYHYYYYNSYSSYGNWYGIIKMSAPFNS